LQPFPGEGQTDTAILKKLSEVDSFVQRYADSTIFHLERAKEILIWLQLDTIRQKQIADFILKEAMQLDQPSRKRYTPGFFDVRYISLNPLYSKYKSLDEEALIRPGASGGITVGFDLTRSVVQKYLLKGIHLPTPGDTMNIDYLASDSTALKFILYVMQNPGRNIMDLYLNASIHHKPTFSKFLQYLNILIRTGLVSYIAPKDSPQIFFVPYSRQVLYKQIRKQMELRYISQDPSWKTWLKLQKSLSYSE
jgi:hypothetical protein